MSDQTQNLPQTTTTATVPTTPTTVINEGVGLSTSGQFELIQRIAVALAKSDLVPKTFQGNIPNCIIAIEMSARLNVSPLMVMQNLNVIQGKPSFSSTFLIAMINSSGNFRGVLKFKYEGAGDKRSCFAYTADQNGEVIEGPKVDIEMAKNEGWLSKTGSKWKTMPDQMLAYRAASFFSRIYCPELTMGLKTPEEIQDAEIVEDVHVSTESTIQDINSQISK